MPTITPIDGPIIMDSRILYGFADGHFRELTATSFNVAVEGSELTYRIDGSGFADTDSDGRPDVGTVETITVCDRDGNPFFTIAGIGRPVANLYSPDPLADLLSGADDITGSTGSDYLAGFGGSDIVRGGLGDDTFLPGGSGDSGDIDRLYGGGGHDFFDYSSYAGRYIVDGGAGIDTLNAVISAPDFDAALAATADGIVLPDGSIIRNVESFGLSFGEGNDTFRGGVAGADYDINLGLGDDVAFLSGGHSVIWSGAVVQEALDANGDPYTIRYGFEDHDVVHADFSDATSAVRMLNVAPQFDENYGTVAFAGTSLQTSETSVYGVNFDEFHVTGSDFDDHLAGGMANDVLYGGLGDDSFTPAFGDDRIDGGQGSDWLDFDIVASNPGAYPGWGVTGGATIDLNSGSPQSLPGYGGTYSPPGLTLGTAVITSIENIRGTDFADDFTGSSAANQLLGMGGNDRLIGNGGNDLLDGGAGGDIMRGGAGNDEYHVDDFADRIAESAGEGVDRVYSSVDYALTANVEQLTLFGSAIRATGNGLDNGIWGNDADNVINGGLGADAMRGGAGDDLYYVDNAGDRVVENPGEGVDRVLSTVTYSATLNVDQIFLRGGSGIDAYGNGLDNLIVGNGAANMLDGRAGADDLRGAGGADIFHFGEGQFGGLTPSTSDRIIDFSHAEGDLIDLSAVDADSALAGDQAFAFIGTGGFNHVAGELRYEQINGKTYVYGDTDGDGVADFMIRLDGAHSLTGGDFIV